MLQIASSNSSGMFRRPIPTLSFSITSLLHGEQPWGFKYHNLLTHFFVGSMVFIFIYKLLSIIKYNEQNAAYFSLLTTALWLIHPLHVSTVLYSVQRMAQFSTLFMLISMSFYLWGRHTEERHKKLIYYFLLFPTTFILALLSKENAVLIPIFILLINFFLQKTDTNLKRPSSTDNIFLYIFVYLPLLVGTLFFLVKADAFLNYSSRDFTISERTLTQISVILLYIKQLLLPELSQMGLYFDDLPINRKITPSIVLQASILLSIVFIGIKYTLKGNLFGFGILFFFAGHLLESTIFPLEIAFEHRNYLPSIGLIICIIFALNKIPNHRLSRFMILGVILIFLTLLSLRANYWKDERSWLLTTIAYHPNSPRTRVDYINYLQKNSEFELSIIEMRKAAQAFPNNITFPLMELLTKCNNASEEDATNLQNTALKLLKEQKLSNNGFNTLAILAARKLVNQCPKVSNKQAEKLIDTAIQYMKNKKVENQILHHLYVLKGQVLAGRGDTIEARDYFILSYEKTQKAQYLFNAVTLLFNDSKFKSKGLELLNEIKAGKYFNPNLYKYEIRKTEEQLALIEQRKNSL